MRIDELLERADRPVFSFEFFPPKTEEGEHNLVRALEALGPQQPDFVSVTYGAGGSTARARRSTSSSASSREFGMEAMAHLTCVNATVDELRAHARRRCATPASRTCSPCAATRRAARTDWTKTEGGFESRHELVELLRADYHFAIGGAAFPETHIHATSAEDDLRYLKAKVDAGAQFLITQMFFDNAYYFDFVERARAIGIDVPIIPGVMPILSSDGSSA